jgi:adenine-specific DNA-methyltransferase
LELVENPDYLARQLITYIGNKRALLTQLGEAIAKVKRRLGRAKLRMLDAFAGSGVVSRFFKAHASHLVSNDLEDFSAVTARCYLRNSSEVDLAAIAEVVNELNAAVANTRREPGFIQRLYSPQDEDNITAGDRVFYTRENARRLDHFRQLIDGAPHEMREMLLGPLVAKASVHANTSGVFKGFYKDRRTKIGRFGGTGGDALSRIRGTIVLEPPVLSRFECEVEVRQQDANELVGSLRDLDVAYFDPPYNQHPYGSNYFMLNLLVHYEPPQRISQVSGIPVDWRRSGYNVRAQSLALVRELVHTVDAKFLLVSFNDEGFITPSQMHALLCEVGDVEVIATPYNTFRGSRNLNNRKLHVTEQLFLVERKR